MSLADAVTPTDVERAAMWPEDIVKKLDWARREIGELEAVNSDLTARREVVSQRAEELTAAVVETRTELTNMGIGLTKTDSYLDRLNALLSSFRSRIGLGGPKDEESSTNSEEDDPASDEPGSGAEDGGEDDSKE